MPRLTCPSLTRLRLSLALALSVVVTSPGLAQSGWRPRLQLDNDVYNYWIHYTHRPDEEYTNGVRVSLESFTAPWWGKRFARGVRDCAEATVTGTCRSTVVTLGQDLYTPDFDHAPYMEEGWELDRPYFAWLYLTGTARVTSSRTLHATSLSLGVTGQPAGGSLAQKVAHQINYNEQPTGWDTQIGFEPGVIAEYRQSRLLLRSAARGVGFDVAPEGAIALGNIRTRAEVGGTGRIGWNLSHPWHPADWRGRASREWWLSAGGRALYVARDMSLDGTLRNPERRVDRIPGVRQYEFGAGLRIHGITAEYRAVTTTREYRTGPGHHTYSSMIVSLR